jgi:hypothetical protein
MLGAIPPLPHYAFMGWYSVKRKHGDNFTFIVQLEKLIHALLNNKLRSVYGIPAEGL